MAEDDSAEIGLPGAADAVLRTLWGQWQTHVIYMLVERQACRFGVLRRTITGISPGWSNPARTETYGLTKTGLAVHAILKDIEKIKV
ncbi:hypothetical protein [Marivita sp. S2033]|uniref:hypothetical protein n=1 Tax=Marivita sp. S2033 TaxID=3373187 RepID=UPI003981B068